MMPLQLQETSVDDTEGQRDSDKTRPTLTRSDRGPSMVIGQSAAGWRPGVTDWLTQKARHVGIAGM